MFDCIAKSKLEDGAKVVPKLIVGFNRYGDYFLVGSNPEPTNPDCGTFWKFMGCLDYKAHNVARWLMPHVPKDSVFSKSVYHSCDSPLCPKCYKYGFAVREAGHIEARLKEASKRFGLPEHIVDSVPEADYGLSLEELRRKTATILKARGIIGGVTIFHAFRYRNPKVARQTGLPVGWYWSPHFHILGFFGGEGYGKCRKCKFNPARFGSSEKCMGCGGFEGLTRKLYEKEGGRAGSGHIVKVLGERKTIGGSAWYQLNHASVRRKNGRTSHVATWFGVCSYRKLKLINGADVGIKHKCPICGKDLVRLRYLGDFSKISISRRGDIVPMFDADGKPLWEIVAERKFKGG